MTVLFINEFDDKTPFLKELSENLCRQKVEVNILDIKKHRLIKYSATTNEYSIEETFKNGVVKYIIRLRIFNIFFKLFYYNCVYTLPKYDHLSYHYVGSIYLFFHRKFSKNGRIKSSAILWGSDFYRSTYLDNQLKKALFHRVNYIGIGNPVMKEDFIRQNPNCSQKVRKVVFGINKLANIAELQSNTSLQKLRKKWEIDHGKIVITIGYNGRPEQQHLRILEALGNSLDDKIHVIIPFGYFGNDGYKSAIINKLKENKLSYTIIDWYSTDTEVAEYRMISDLAINGQTTDAMSASVQEHFYAGSVLLVGQWLPYGYFQELGLKFTFFSWKNLLERFDSIVENLGDEKRLAMSNKEIIWLHSAWSSAVKGWVTLYNED